MSWAFRSRTRGWQLGDESGGEQTCGAWAGPGRDPGFLTTQPEQAPGHLASRRITETPTNSARAAAKQQRKFVFRAHHTDRAPGSRLQRAPPSSTRWHRQATPCTAQTSARAPGPDPAGRAGGGRGDPRGWETERSSHAVGIRMPGPAPSVRGAATAQGPAAGAEALSPALENALPRPQGATLSLRVPLSGPPTLVPIAGLGRRPCARHTMSSKHRTWSKDRGRGLRL